ncbi:preprotein translocase subunit SecG [Anaeromonas gelatinilytica]|uniref:preprotein translocase subunit SecG n=1 Tax=Anaeromonas gelatinilytica TaxID=2683194 RepID=UPI003315CD4C
MSTVAIVFTVLLIIASIMLIVSILLQSGKSAGLSGSIAGGAENVWGKKKGRGYEAILSRITTISAITFILSSLILVAVQ